MTRTFLKVDLLQRSEFRKDFEETRLLNAAISAQALGSCDLSPAPGFTSIESARKLWHNSLPTKSEDRKVMKGVLTLRKKP